MAYFLLLTYYIPVEQFIWRSDLQHMVSMPLVIDGGYLVDGR
jgi:hypothetical protein